MGLDVLSMTPLPTRADAPVVLMVSGGSDSTALLVRAATDEIDLRDGTGPARLAPERLVALHVHHGIRGAAADRDEAFVRRVCAQLGVTCEVRHVDVPAACAARAAAGEVANLEEVARELRYGAAWEVVRQRCAAARVDVRCARVLVAHTADDRAETFLMRAMTGAGLTGLAGMRPTRGLVVRPLLEETREGCRDYLRERGVGWCEDETNDADDALRSYVRHHVTPAMRRRAPEFARAMGRACDNLARDADLLDRLARTLLLRVIRPSLPDDDAYLAREVPMPGEPRVLHLDADALAQAEPALATRAARWAVELALGEEAARRARLEERHVAWVLGLARLDADLGRGMPSASVTLPLDTVVTREGGLVVVRPAAAADARERGRAGRGDGAGERGAAARVASLPVPGRVAWGAGELVADLVPVPPGADARAVARRALAEVLPQGGREGREAAVLDAAAAGVAEGGALVVRGAIAGERMRPFGLGGHGKLVRDVLADAHVPASERASAAVVHAADAQAAGEGASPGGCGAVVWVAGIRSDERAAYRPDSGVLLRLSFMVGRDRSPLAEG